MSYLLAAHKDAASADVVIGDRLTSVIEQAISSNTGRGFTTFEAFDMALSRVATTASAPAAPTVVRTWIERIFGASR